MPWSSFKCRDNTRIESPWDALNWMGRRDTDRPLLVLGNLYRAKTSQAEGWLAWSRQVAIDPKTILGEEEAEKVSRAHQHVRKVGLKWKAICVAFSTNDGDEDSLLKWADGLFPFHN
jgi:hypothetical protein